MAVDTESDRGARRVRERIKSNSAAYGTRDLQTHRWNTGIARYAQLSWAMRREVVGKVDEDGAARGVLSKVYGRGSEA